MTEQQWVTLLTALGVAIPSILGAVTALIVNIKSGHATVQKISGDNVQALSQVTQNLNHRVVETEGTHVA